MKQKQMIREAFRNTCLDRDNNKCKVCASIATEVHHIFDRRFLPEHLKYVSENGISLCNPCHQLAEKFHQTKGKSWTHGLHPDDLYILINSKWRTAMWPTIRESYYVD